MADSVDKKLDLILGEIALLREKTDTIASLVAKVSSLEIKLAVSEATIVALSSEVKYLKDRDNARDQSDRQLSLRIFNVPGSNSETGLTSKVYEDVLKPLLSAAKSQGEIPTLPQVGTTIAECYRAGKFSPGSNKPPPPGYRQVPLRQPPYGRAQVQAQSHPCPPGGLQAHHHRGGPHPCYPPEVQGASGGRQGPEGLDPKRHNLGGC